MATHSGILAWEIPWTEAPGGLQTIKKKVEILSGVCACAQSLQVCLILLQTPWTVAYHPPLSVEFSRQEHWSGLPFPSPGDLPDPVIEPVSSVSPALVGRSFYQCTIWEA